MTHTNWAHRAAAALALGVAALASTAAQAVTIAYTTPIGAGNKTAYLVDWRTATAASVVADRGARNGSYVDAAGQRRLTLSSPLTSFGFSAEIDPCLGTPADLRFDTTQLVFRLVSGTASRGESTVLEVGTSTVLNGCNAGLVEPFGIAGEPGLATLNLATTLRAPTTDLVPGQALAGWSEQAWPADEFVFLAQDVVTFLAGNQVRFESTGTTLPWFNAPQGWRVLQSPGHALGYLRLTVDPLTQAETWLVADWVAGRPQRVQSATMVKPAAPAGFGTTVQASRQWESGIFSATTTPFFIHLYRDLTGERVSRNLIDNTEVRSPITWAFNGRNIVQTRSLGGFPAARTWVPLRNVGTVRWVLESEVRQLPDGDVSFIAPRVNLMIDRGAAFPPTPTGAAAASRPHGRPVGPEPAALPR